MNYWVKRYLLLKAVAPRKHTCRKLLRIHIIQIIHVLVMRTAWHGQWGLSIIHGKMCLLFNNTSINLIFKAQSQTKIQRVVGPAVPDPLQSLLCSWWLQAGAADQGETVWSLLQSRQAHLRPLSPLSRDSPAECTLPALTRWFPLLWTNSDY